MALTFTTPNMLLIVPTPEQQLGPTWAQNLNDCLSKVDLHDHTTGKGVKVPSAGLNINDDVDFQNNDAKNLRSSAYQNSVAPLPNTDVRALYSSGGNLFYNNSDGTPIQITTGTSINTGALAINVWTYQSVTSNLVIPSNAAYIYLGTSTAAPRAITLPAANAVTAGRFFVIKDRTGGGATNSITINPAGTNTINNVNVAEVINYAYGTEIFVSDGVSNWMTFKEGSGGATLTTLGTIKLAGDLAGTGSTANTPRVVSATNSVPGKVQLAGDLNGDSTVFTAPTIGKLTGISGGVSMGSTPATSGASGAGNTSNTGIRLSNTGSSTSNAGLSVRNNTNTTNINVASLNGFNEVRIGDDAVVTRQYGGHRVRAIIYAGSGNVNLDTGNKDHVVLANPSGLLQFLLPSAEIGREIVVKDISGNCATNNIQVYCTGGKTIDGLTVGLGSTITLAANYGSLKFVADANGNWWTV